MSEILSALFHREVCRCLSLGAQLMQRRFGFSLKPCFVSYIVWQQFAEGLNLKIANCFLSGRLRRTLVVKGGVRVWNCTEFGARAARSASGAGVSPGVCDVVGFFQTSFPRPIVFLFLKFFIIFCVMTIFFSFSRYVFSIFNFRFLVNLFLWGFV